MAARGDSDDVEAEGDGEMEAAQRGTTETSASSDAVPIVALPGMEIGSAVALIARESDEASGVIMTTRAGRKGGDGAMRTSPWV